jgi:hypothetical protein
MFKATLQLIQSAPLSLYIQWMYLNYPPLCHKDDVSYSVHDFLHSICILCTTYWPKQYHNTAAEYVKHWLGTQCALFALLLTCNWCHTNLAYNVNFFFFIKWKTRDHTTSCTNLNIFCIYTFLKTAGWSYGNFTPHNTFKIQISCLLGIAHTCFHCSITWWQKDKPQFQHEQSQTIMWYKLIYLQ